MSMNTHLVPGADNAKMIGHLKIMATPKGCPGGFCIFSGHNKIMDEAKAFVLSAIYDNAFVPDPISTFKVGNDGTITTNGNDPRVVTGDRTDLFDPIATGYTNVVSAPALSSGGRVATFSFSVLDTELNGEYINEVGMFRLGGTMFNMKTFPSILKTSGFSLTFIWTIRHL